MSYDIEIDLTEFKNTLEQVLEGIVTFSEQRDYEVENFEMTPGMFQEIAKVLQEYPDRHNLLKAIQERDEEYLEDSFLKLFRWNIDQPRNYDVSSKTRTIIQYVRNYADQLTYSGPSYSREKAKEDFQRIVEEEYRNMTIVRDLIQTALLTIPHWGGTPLKVIARNPSDGFQASLAASFDCEVEFASLGPSGDLSPNFTLFVHDDKSIAVDDVLEGGDSDFFTDDVIQADYFALVNALRNYGKPQKTKFLTLYTARPVKDRSRYENATSLPHNIFLTNKFDHALGLASDLGSSEVRDVWKVRMDSRYLTKTLEGPVEYYQVTVPNAPIRSIDLVYTAH